MIIVNLMAALLLIPLTVILIITFNVYSKHWMFLSALAIFVFLYTTLFGVLFGSAAAVLLFMLIAILYVIRIKSLARHLQTRRGVNDYPLLRGAIHCKHMRLHMVLYFPLSFLRLCRFLPSAADKELKKKFGIQVGISELLELIARQSAGAHMEIKHEAFEVNFEII